RTTRGEPSQGSPTMSRLRSDFVRRTSWSAGGLLAAQAGREAGCGPGGPPYMRASAESIVCGVVDVERAAIALVPTRRQRHGAAADLGSVLDGLVLCIESWKSRQQRRMNVQHASAERAKELPTQQPHESCQANQVNFISLKLVDQLAIVNLTVQPQGRKYYR